MPTHPAPCSDQHRVAKRAKDVKGVTLLVMKWEFCKNTLKQSQVPHRMYKHAPRLSKHYMSVGVV
jgi:hypothetical protein